MTHLGKLALAFVAASFAWQPSISFAQTPDERIKQILNDWKVRKDRYKAVKYSMEGVVEAKYIPEMSGIDPKKLPKLPYSKPMSYEVLIDITGGRFRIEKREEVFSYSSGRFILRVTTNAYDRKAYQTFVPRVVNGLSPEDSEISLMKGDLHQVHVEAELWPLFYAHGLIPTVNAPLRPDKWPTDHEPEDFIFRSSTPVAGKPCTVFRSEPMASSPGVFDEFYIGQTSDSPVLRHVYYSGKNPWYLIDVTYRKNENGSLPEKWELTHSIGGKVSHVYRLAVKSVEVNPAITDADFTLPIEPGMLVSTSIYPEAGKGLDSTHPAQTTYRAGESGSKTVLEAKGFTTTEGVQLPAEKDGWPRWSWWFAYALIGTGVLAALRWIVRRRISARLR